MKWLNNKLFKHSFLFTFFSFLNNGIGFILILLLARYLAPEEYGQLNLFTTVVAILPVLISLNTNGYLSISFFNSTKEKIKEIINTILLVSLFSFLILFLLIILFANNSEKIIGISALYQLIALIVCTLQLFNTLRLEIWRLEEKPVAYGLFSFFFALSNLILTLFLIIQLDMNWQGRVYTLLITSILFFLIAVILLYKENLFSTIKPNKNTIKSALSYGIPLVPHTLSTWVRQGLDRYIINYFWGIEQVGYFSFAFNIYNVMLMIGMAFNASNSVHIFKTLANEDEITAKKTLKKQIKIMSLFFICMSIIICVVCYLLVIEFFPKYNSSLPYLFPFIIAGLFQCLYFLFVNFLFYYKKTKKIMYITISVAITHLLLSFIFTRFGMIYTAYISMLSNILIFVLIFFYSCKYIGYSLPIKLRKKERKN